MRESDIRRYAALMSELNLTGMEINENDGRIRLERAPRHASDISHGTAVNSTSSEKPENINAEEITGLSSAERNTDNEEKSSDFGLISVKSPIVGIFYSSPTENADVFVKEGDTVKKGTVLCIIESMKLMNEITAEESGIVESVLVKNGQPVEYGTELFKIRKEAV